MFRLHQRSACGLVCITPTMWIVDKIPLDRTNRSMSFSKHILSLGLEPGQKQDAVTYSRALHSSPRDTQVNNSL